MATGEAVRQWPPRLEFTPVPNGILLTWPPGYFLQSATRVAGPYSDMYILTGAYLVQPGNEPERFFVLSAAQMKLPAILSFASQPGSKEHFCLT